MTDKQNNDTAVEKPAPPEEQTVTTSHVVTIGGQEISYTATAGTLVLHEESDEKGTAAKATIFYVAYAKEGEDAAGRPLTFSFNGGPGSSSVWLHLGLLGPRRVWLDEQGNFPRPPFRLVDNEFSLLDVTDLVFIDPVSTGYSRSVPGEEAQQFHGFKKDIETVAEFIRLYTTRNGRWLSPKFLIGESYGTTRAAGLAGHLQDKHGMYLNGVMLISAILHFMTGRFQPGNDMPYILFLPTYTATAWFHKKLDESLQANLMDTLAQVEKFSLEAYAPALLKGDQLPAEEAAEIARKLAHFTGLSEAYVVGSNLRIEAMRFMKELRRSERLTVGRLDSRFVGVDRDNVGEKFEYDPSYANIQGPYTATLNDYVRRELGFESDLPYEILTGRVQPWSYNEFENQFVNVAETLRQAINQNPYLKVHVANGYFDLATPYFATHYTFNHLGLEPDLRDNVSMAHYEAGHMMYIHRPSLAKQKTDLAAFIHAAL